jgi:predicted RNA binding protein YcfA (HicA-like mRNA interferase family)
MPPKVRELIKALEAAGFKQRPGKGSHRRLAQPRGVRLTISGQLRADAQHYQVRLVKQAIEETRDD